MEPAEALSLDHELAACEQARAAGDHAQGVACGQRALALALAAHDVQAAARVRALLAHHHWRLGQAEPALPLAEAALAYTDASGPPEAAIELRHTLTMVLCELGLPGEALPHATAALDGARVLGSARWLSWSLNRLSVVHDVLGDSIKAVALMQQAAEAADQCGDEEACFSAQINLAITLESLATRHKDVGEHEPVAPLAQQALVAAGRALERAGAHPVRRLYCLGIEAYALELLGRVAEMPSRIEEHQAIARRLELAHFVARGELMRASWRLASGDAEAAWDGVQHALLDAGLEHDESLRRTALSLRYRAAKATGRLGEAVAALEQLLVNERNAATQRLQSQSRVLLRTLAVQMARDEAQRLRAQAADLAQRAAEATQAALADALTGLANRRALDARLHEWLLREPGRGAPFSAAMIDIDHFKRINDRFGHEVGDAVLRALARLLQADLPEGSMVARNGGEEFVVLLAGSPQAAGETCARLRRAVEKHDWSGVLPTGGVTISIGLTAAQAGDDVSGLLRRADMAMYAAKRAGRNRLVLG
jgi:diguanylate cyclase